MKEKLLVKNLLNLEKTISKNLFIGVDYPFEIITKISEFITEFGNTLSEKEYKKLGQDIWISREAEVYDSAFIKGPTIICSGAQVRHCAFIRGNTIIGKNSVVGNSTELKNAILFDSTQVPHYNYVGDSILGYKAHMGAGSITSNVKSNKSLVKIKYNNIEINTSLRKLGSILGDYVEVGCNSVLNPGVIIGRNTDIYPLSMVRGFISENSIYKTQSNIIKKYKL